MANKNKSKEISQDVSGLVSSMTGFGEASETISFSDQSQSTIKVQCRSVNHRFLDVVCKMPSRYSAYEMAIQKLVKSKLQRGKVDILVSRESSGVENVFQLNLDLIKSSFSQISNFDSLGVDRSQVNSALLQALFQRREVLELSGSTDVGEAEKELLDRVILLAVESLLKSRKEEGRALESEVRNILSQINSLVSRIDDLSRGAPEIVKKRFEDRLSSLYSSYSKDDQRMLQEIAILSDKVDIREEIVRLQAHIVGFEKALSEGGRKLEFIVQEMGREINTIGSKTSQIEVSTDVISVKSLLEKLREQLQNIE